MHCDLTPIANGKVDKFLKVLEKEGITLKEPERLMPDYPWTQHRSEKPWEVLE
jgi:hypothetical protein